MSEDGNSPSKTKANLRPLIDWYRANKPDVKTIAVAPDDYLRLEGAQQKTLAKHGFTKVLGGFRFEEFTLRKK